jgi:hypothetical protein
MGMHSLFIFCTKTERVLLAILGEFPIHLPQSLQIRPFFECDISSSNRSIQAEGNQKVFDKSTNVYKGTSFCCQTFRIFKVSPFASGIRMSGIKGKGCRAAWELCRVA